MSDFKQATIDTYQKIAADFNKANFDPFWVNEVETYITLLSGKKIIDIGCGTGRDAVVFTQRGFDYTGIDASSEMLKIAKERAPQGTYQVMDFYSLDFPDETFDGFWAAASFLHVPKSDVSKLILEAKRVLKYGGVGFISLKERNGVEEGMIEQKRDYGTIARYFSFYEKEEFKKYLTDAGLEVVKEAVFHEDDERNTVWLGYFVRKS